MAWTYIQTSGRLLNPYGVFTAVGYSGCGDGKNNPTEENIRCVGPIPEGIYDIEEPIDSPLHGPFAMHLLPSVENIMYGRSAFLIHGDSLNMPGGASEGCVILSKPVREKIWNSNDHVLQVVKN